MTEEETSKFMTKRRAIGSDGELKWGGEDGEEWSEAVESSEGITVTDVGTIVPGVGIPESGVSRWTFDDSDTQSGTSIDSWGNNDATIESGVTTAVNGSNVTYDTNEAYEFSSSAGSVVTTSIDIPLQWSVAAWVYPITYDDYLHVLTNQASQGNFTCKASKDGYPYFYSDSGRTGSSDVSESLTTGEWNHLVYLYDGSYIRIYLDGSEIGNSAETPTDPSSENYIVNGGNGEYTDFRQTDLRLFNKALSSSEVSNLYQTGRISG